MIDAAIDNSVEKVMALSTDKAVHPVNLYGAMKMVAEKLFVQGNTYAGVKKCAFSCIRYGNVIWSRGSVIPVFKEQKKTGTIAITDERMTRFWITLDQGVRFVIDCVGRMKGGEILVPKIPSMKISDLAKAIAPEAKWNIIGICAGEKLHEILLTEDEARHTKEFDSYFAVEPEHPFWNEGNFSGGGVLPEWFRYASNNNDRWLTIADLHEIIEHV